MFYNISARFLCSFMRRVLGLVLYCGVIQFICKRVCESTQKDEGGAIYEKML